MTHQATETKPNMEIAKKFAETPLLKYSDDSRPSELNTRQVSVTVDKVVKWIQDQFKPSRIVKGGSYGKATHVQGRNEVDLVVFFPLLETEQNESGVMSAVEKRRNDFARLLKVLPENITPHGVKYRFGTDELSVSFDILPVPDIDIDKLSDKLEQQVRAVATEKQIDFIKHQDAGFKDLVRVCKIWRDKFDLKKMQSPSSYLVELLALRAYEDCNGSSYTLERGFDAFLDLLQSDTFSISWTRFYYREAIIESIDRRFPNETRVVIDPANKRNNVASVVSDWTIIQQIAKWTKQCLPGVSLMNMEVRLLEEIRNGQREMHNSIIRAMTREMNGVKNSLNVLIAHSARTNALLTMEARPSIKTQFHRLKTESITIEDAFSAWLVGAQEIVQRVETSFGPRNVQVCFATFKRTRGDSGLIKINGIPCAGESGKIKVSMTEFFYVQ